MTNPIQSGPTQSSPIHAKVDLKKLDSYRATGEFRVVEVPTMTYLMIDGSGDPNTDPAFTAAIEALFPLAYRLKFASKRELGRDYVVMPLEGLWWAPDMSAFTTARDKRGWSWTLMVLVPEWTTQARFTRARDELIRGGRLATEQVRLAELAEGRCVQTLHLGSYEDEAPVLDRLHHEFLPAQGLEPTGRHHEIYLSDFRKVAPDRLRTILRQPVAAAR